MVPVAGAGDEDEALSSSRVKTVAPISLRRNRDGDTKVLYRGFWHTRANATSVKAVYRCSRYRSRKCKGRVEFHAVTMQFIAESFVPHTCGARAVPDTASSGHGAVAGMEAALDERSVKDAMKDAVDRHASTTTLLPREIWELVRAEFYDGAGTEDGVCGLSREQVMRRVYSTRYANQGGTTRAIAERLAAQPPERRREEEEEKGTGNEAEIDGGHDRLLEELSDTCMTSNTGTSTSVPHKSREAECEKEHLALLRRQVVATEAIARHAEELLQLSRDKLAVAQERVRVSRDEAELKLFAMQSDPEDDVAREYLSLKRRQARDRLKGEFYDLKRKQSGGRSGGSASPPLPITVTSSPAAARPAGAAVARSNGRRSSTTTLDASSLIARMHAAARQQGAFEEEVE